MPTQACVCGRTPTNALIILYSYPKTEKSQDSTNKYYAESISIKEEYYHTKKNIIAEKGETLKNILSIEKNIVPLHRF